jgi:hypothetical protein
LTQIGIFGLKTNHLATLNSPRYRHGLTTAQSHSTTFIITYMYVCSTGRTVRIQFKRLQSIQGHPSYLGQKLWFLKYFRRNFRAFFAQNKAKLFKILIITLDFEKTPFFSQKIGKNHRN